MGFVREAPVREAAPGVSATERQVPAPASNPARSSTTREYSSPVSLYHPPSDPVGKPSPDIVAGCSSLSELEQAIHGCLACPLGPGRLHFVFGEGNPDADLMFIGEGPGRDEDLQGRPFVGKAGELLDKMIGAIGLKRGDIYIANIVKCRPPDNRTPSPQEAGTCLGFLHRQIQLVNPKVIVTLGATPLRELVGVTTGITRVRGQWLRLDLCGGIPLMPTFHPAYVLRQYTQEVRRAVWEDLKAAKKWIDDSEGEETSSDG
jgi:uracil-DNA glycosylase family 4